MVKRKLDVLIIDSNAAKKLLFYFICSRVAQDSFEEDSLMDVVEVDRDKDFLTAFERFKDTIKFSRRFYSIEFEGKLNGSKRVDIVNFISGYFGKSYNLN
ncbi:hypothetical protein GOV13_04975 [Candidatus Pacearchaeota archaeon]|nr:hypothetical protein [Candidatus Pacearchaeota archaeon]